MWESQAQILSLVVIQAVTESEAASVGPTDRDLPESILLALL